MKQALEIVVLVINSLPAIGKFIVQIGRKERKRKQEKKQLDNQQKAA